MKEKIALIFTPWFVRPAKINSNRITENSGILVCSREYFLWWLISRKLQSGYPSKFIEGLRVQHLEKNTSG
jgi:hypothetical protein